MNELSESTETARPAASRPPVVWRFASVTDEHQSVSVVFPVTADLSENRNDDTVPEVTKK